MTAHTFPPGYGPVPTGEQLNSLATAASGGITASVTPFILLGETDGGTIQIKGANGVGTHNGGDAILHGGNSGHGATGNAGFAELLGGDAVSTNGTGGGTVNSAGAGSGTGQGGPANLNGGNGGFSGNGGYLALTSGNGGFAADTNAGDITLSCGDGANAGNGGTIWLYTGNTDTGTAGNIVLTLGTGGTNGDIELANVVSTPGAAAGTLTNAPHSGNPQTWLRIVINGVVHFIPAWHL